MINELHLRRFEEDMVKIRVLSIMAIGMALLVALSTGCGVSQEEHGRLNSELEASREQITKLQNELKASQEQVAEVQGQVIELIG